MEKIVCKFGGTSCASAENILRVQQIVAKNANRKFIVVSAPGKRYAEDTKVTDLLYTCHQELVQTGQCKQTFQKIYNRFIEIADRLQVNDMQPILKDTKRAIEERKSLDFTLSRGEYLNAYCIAKSMHLPFIDAKELIFFDSSGNLDEKKTYSTIYKKMQTVMGAVIPGFYGVDANGNIKTFSRGGSDITGAIVARGIQASLYENWTDVDGFLACDPSIVPNAKKIEKLSFKELRELSYMGANILHADCIFPLVEQGIAIQIKNTFNPSAIGTTILPTHMYTAPSDTITSIAGKKDFVILHVEKAMIQNEVGVVYQILKSFQKEGIPFEYMASAVDVLSFVIDSKYLQGNKQTELLKQIEDTLHPNLLKMIENIAILSIVGHGMQKNIAIPAKILQTIAAENIQIYSINQSSNQMSVCVAVANIDFEKTIQALYKAFFAENTEYIAQ